MQQTFKLELKNAAAMNKTFVNVNKRTVHKRVLNGMIAGLRNL